MRPISTHDRFFSSLKQVEKRLASEKEPIPIATPSSPVSFSSPLYLSASKPHPAALNPFPQDESSGPASGFLSVPPSPDHDHGPPHDALAAEARIHDDNKEEGEEEEEDDDDDDINRLISLLGLSKEGEDDGGASSCHCSGTGFYRNAVGLKGPMCAREMERIDGWIKHYRRGRREPARLAHLLLAKAVSAAAANGGGDDEGFGSIGFPPTVEEFLKFDPPFEENGD